MAASPDPSELRHAIVAKSPDVHPLLFLWLTAAPTHAAEYAEVADTLLAVSERNLAHLVVHRGLALFPDSDALALFALRLELNSLPQAA